MLTRVMFSAPVLLLVAGISWSAPVVIPINCGGNQVGQISVDTSGTGISGGFTSSVGTPNSLAAAAQACGEDHFNWYQIVTADNHPPRDRQGNRLTPPYVDVPPGGYFPADDPTWADDLPWYYDEYTPAPGTPNVNNGLLLSTRTHPNLLDYGDDPGGQANTNLSFKTWLVSLNCCTSVPSFHAFHEGFSWDWTNASGTGVVSNIKSLGAGVFPTNAEYANLIGGFQTNLPEPGTLLLTGMALALVAAVRRKL